jgi:AraC-like DNA-binding protein
MIGKTRQPSAQVQELYDPEVGRARGMFRRPLPAGKLRHVRRKTAHDLAPWIAHYWMIRWDLRGCAPHVAESLPHPNIHMIFEDRVTVVCGVQTKKFSRLLQGESRVFGIKFQAGGFRPFYRASVSGLADRIVPAKEIFGNAVGVLEAAVFSSRPDNEKIAACNNFFLQRIPNADPSVTLARQLVALILADPEIKSVDELVRRSPLGKRSLQRLFNEYVGASPKWVIRRYRLMELVEKFNSGGKLDWPQLALELGYFDQAHLINDFKAVVGHAPTKYQKLVGKRA